MDGGLRRIACFQTSAEDIRTLRPIVQVRFTGGNPGPVALAEIRGPSTHNSPCDWVGPVATVSILQLQLRSRDNISLKVNLSAPDV